MLFGVIDNTLLFSEEAYVRIRGGHAQRLALRSSDVTP